MQEIKQKKKDGQIRNINGKGSVQQNQCSLHFGDWITIENGTSEMLGHLNAKNGFGLQLIKENNSINKYRTFCFFEVLKENQQNPQTVVRYSTHFYLKHVQTGLYLSSAYDQGHKNALFDHVSLKSEKSRSCLFMFKREIKQNKSTNYGSSQTTQTQLSDSNQNGKKYLNQDNSKKQMKILEQEKSTVTFETNLRIYNVLSQKYLQLIKTQITNTKNNPFQNKPYRVSYTSHFNEQVNDMKQSKKTTFSQSKSTFWLSSNFEYFTLRLQRRQIPYNPVFLCNYDTVMIFNTFSQSYLGIKKKRQLIQITNALQKSDPFGSDDILSNKASSIPQPSNMTYSEQNYKQTSQFHKQSTEEQNQRIQIQKISSYQIMVNSQYLSAKNCFIQQTPINQLHNKHTLSYLWKVFVKPEMIGKKQQITKSQKCCSCLIKSKQLIYFQHIETGLFMVKNQNEGETAEEYILRDQIDLNQNQQNNNSDIFMFRAQNLTLIRYNNYFLFNQQFKNNQQQEKNSNISSINFQLVNTSLHVTLDFQEEEFIINKISQYPRVHYFSYHFPEFINILISFLNNPKAIDDRIQLLKQKLAIMEMIYDRIICQGYCEIVNQIDKGYYFFQNSVKMLKVIRIKMKQMELQVKQLKSSRQNSNKNKKKEDKEKNNGINLDGTEDNYIFENLNKPYEELLDLYQTILCILRPLIKKILNYLALVFGSGSRDIFDIICQKQKADDMINSIKKKPVQNSQLNSKNQQHPIKKKNSAIMSNSLAKKRMRNNSVSSFKASSSIISEGSFMIKDQNGAKKSPFAKGVDWNEKEECSSEITRELIRSLIHLLQVQPKGSCQILKLISIQQPYEIVGQLNQKLQNLEQIMSEIQGSAGQNKNGIYQQSSNSLVGTSLKMYKHFQSLLFVQMFHCVQLINYILQYFDQDLQYDWTNKLGFIQTHFEIKTFSNKESKIYSQKQTIKKDGDITIHYKKSWHKLSQILQETQNPKFKKLFKIVKHNKKIPYQNKSKKLLATQRQKINNEINHQELITDKKSSQTSLKKESQKFISKKQLQKQSSSQLIKLNSLHQVQKIRDKQRRGLFFRGQSKDKKFDESKIIAVKKIILTKQQRDVLFQYLKQTVKLKLLNLKSNCLSVSQMLSFLDLQINLTQKVKNPFSQYSNLSSLTFILEVANNIDATLLNGISSSQFISNYNISLLNNSRFICCDNKPISQRTNLFKVFNIKIKDEQNNYNYPLILKQDNIRYLIEESSLNVQFFQVIFCIFIEVRNLKKCTDLGLRELFIEAISGLKAFLISLQIFISVGNFDFEMLKRVQIYLLEICSFVTHYYADSKEQSGKFGKIKADNLQNDKNNKKNEGVFYVNNHLQGQEKDKQNETTTGIQDSIQSLLVEMNQLMEILYIQKKRIIRYPFIQNPYSFFQAPFFKSKYLQLINSSTHLLNQIPILTDMFSLNHALHSSQSILNLAQPFYVQQQHRFPIFLNPKLFPLNHTLCHTFKPQQNYTLLTWPYLSLHQIQIFYRSQSNSIETQTFQKTAQTIIKLHQLTLMLNTLESMQQSQNVRNHFIIEIKQKISSIAKNLQAIAKLQPNKKIIKAFGLVQIILTIILNNVILQKGSIKPFIEFLIEIQMWNDTYLDFFRVLNKGGLRNIFQTLQEHHDVPFQNSFIFFAKNIQKQQFFLLTAKYLERIQSSSQKLILIKTLSLNLIQLLDHVQNQPYRSLMQKLSFVNLILQNSQNQQICENFLNKLMNRQDVQLYMQALRTYKNFQYFCQNIKNFNILLYNKKLINDKFYVQNYTSENFNQSATPKNSSIFNHTNNMTSNIKLKKVTNETGNEKDEMTTFKKQEINKFVILMTATFKAYKRTKKSIDAFFNAFLSYKEILKILRANVTAVGNSYELMKPLLVYLQSNQEIFSCETFKNSSNFFNCQNQNFSQSVSNQNELLPYLQTFNEILSNFHIYTNELQTYQSNSTFFLSLIDQNQSLIQQTLLQFNQQKVKKITSELNNFSRKTYFWQLLLWNPCYEKQEGLLVDLEKIIMSNLNIFVCKGSFKHRNPHKNSTHNVLQKLEIPINRIFHSIFDNILNIGLILETFKGSRYLRIKTRVKKVRKILTDIFPSIEESLMNFKSLKLKQIKQKQDQTDSHVIEQQDQESLGFISSENKNHKSQNSYYERQESFESLTRKMKNIKNTKMIPQQLKTLEVKRRKLSDQKSMDPKFSSQMIGYHFVTKLSSNGKLEKFINYFQDLECNRYADQQRYEMEKQMSLKEQMQSLSLNQKNYLIGNIEEYLQDQSQDHVIDEAHNKMNQYGKSQRLKGSGNEQFFNSRQKLQIRQKKSKSELNEVQSLGDSANYSHHAMIIAQNSLNYDSLSKKRQGQIEQSSLGSRFGEKSSKGNLRKIMRKKKGNKGYCNLKKGVKGGYGNLNEGLKQYKFYEVGDILKRVIFCRQKGEEWNNEGQDVREYESEVYYELERLLLEYMEVNGSLNNLFQYIENFIKVQAEKAFQRQLEVKYSSQTSGVRIIDDSVPMGSRLIQRGSIGRMQDKIDQHCQDEGRQDRINGEILVTLLRRQLLLQFRQNYQLISQLINQFLKSTSAINFIDEQSPFNLVTKVQRQSTSKDSSQLYHCLQSLISLLHQNQQTLLTPQNYLYHSHHSLTHSYLTTKQQFHHQKQITSPVSQSIFKSQIKFISNPSQTHLNSSSQSSISKPINSHHKISKNINFNHKSNQIPRNHSSNMVNVEKVQIYLFKKYLIKRLQKLRIFFGLLKILNPKLANIYALNAEQDFSLAKLLKQIHTSLTKFIYETIRNIDSLSVFLHKRQQMSQINSNQSYLFEIELLTYHIRLQCLKHLTELKIFLSFNRQRKNQKNYNQKFIANPQYDQFQIIRHILVFSLKSSYRKLTLNQLFYQTSQNHQKDQLQFEERHKKIINRNSLDIGSIGLLKQYFISVSKVIKNQNLEQEKYNNRSFQFTHEVISGTLNYSLECDLVSQNVQSYQMISLLTKCFTLIQVFLCSISSANIIKNNLKNQFTLVYYSQQGKQIQNAYFHFDIAIKLIKFEILIYSILFESKNPSFNCSSLNYYLRKMINSSQQTKNQSQFNFKTFDHQEAKTQRYLALLQLLIEVLNIFHNIFFKFSNFPQFQHDLYEQRKIFINNHKNLNQDQSKLKKMYEHLSNIFRCVIVSPQKKKDNSKFNPKLQVVTYPFIRQFDFVWKNSLIKLSQSFIDQNQRKNVILAASKVFLSQNCSLRKITLYIVKWSKISTYSSEAIIILLLFLNTILGGLKWVKGLTCVLLVLNLVFVTLNAIERVSSTFIMTSLIKTNKQIPLINIFTVILLVFVPLAVGIVANFYSFWNNKSVPFMLLFFVFNRIEYLYATFQKHSKVILLTIIFLFSSLMTIFGFQFFVRFDLDPDLVKNQSYTSKSDSLFHINQKPFNFLSMLFQFPESQYVTNPLIIIFYFWLYIIQILVVAIIVLSITQKLKSENVINSDTGKAHQCFVCSVKAQSLLQQQIKNVENKEKDKNLHFNKSNKILKKLKSQIFDSQQQLKKFSKKSMTMNGPQREQELNKILFSHIKQRHNLFSYISYFCYLLDKKQKYLTEKQKLIKKRVEQKDCEIYL